MDFIRPDSGSIQLFDGSPRAPHIRKQIGYLPEVTNFPANLSVHDLLRFTGATCDIPKELLHNRSRELLTTLDLWEVRRRPLRTYSKGMQQRANFAIALINDPELLILDEPMSGLDPMGRKKIIDLITQLKGAGKTILFCSHILEDVDRLADNILLLHKGRNCFMAHPANWPPRKASHPWPRPLSAGLKRRKVMCNPFDSARRVSALARLIILDGLLRHALIGLVLFALAGTTGGLLLFDFIPRDIGRASNDFLFSITWLTGFIFLLFHGVQVMAWDSERGALHTFLARPISRTEYALAPWTGAALLALNVILGGWVGWC